MKPPVFEEMPKFKARVWDDDFPQIYEKNVIVVGSKGWCIDDKRSFWPHCELIEEPKFRPFRDRDEFIQWLRDTGRTDMRVIDESGDMMTINYIYGHITKLDDCLKLKWFDNGEPVGVKE